MHPDEIDQMLFMHHADDDNCRITGIPEVSWNRPESSGLPKQTGHYANVSQIQFA